jgi:hypothetical protein
MISTTAARAAALLAALAASSPARAADLSLSAVGGYQGGAGLRLAATVGNAVSGLPVALSAGVGYTRRDPGDPLLARAVFVNQNTNGTPEESGRIWDLRLDVVYLFELRGLREAGAFLGVRHSWFMGDFRYVGGNEDFEVVSSTWGWGAGVRGALAMTPAWSLALQVGFDHYPAWSMTGHDATYASDGSSVNAHSDGAGYTYTWRDADEAVSQPKFVPSLLFGVTWRPGAAAPARRR